LLLVGLAIGLVARVITGHQGASAAIAGGLFAALMGLWFVFPHWRLGAARANSQ